MISADYEIEDELSALEDELPLLLAVREFVGVAINADYFSNLGARLDSVSTDLAQGYFAALGISSSISASPAIAAHADWEAALEAAEAGDINSPAWEAEEQLRIGALSAASAAASEEGLELVLTYLSAQLEPVLRERLGEVIEEAGYEPQDIPQDVFIGAALSAAQSAALVYALEKSGDKNGERDFSEHPLTLKYEIFTRGHWPIAIIGETLHVF